MKFEKILAAIEENCADTIPNKDKINLTCWLDNALAFAGIENLTDEQLAVFSRAMRNAYWRGQENR